MIINESYQQPQHAERDEPPRVRRCTYLPPSFHSFLLIFLSLSFSVLLSSFSCLLIIFSDSKILAANSVSSMQSNGALTPSSSSRPGSDPWHPSHDFLFFHYRMFISPPTERRGESKRVEERLEERREEAEANN